jgi:hypothetical protein
MIRLKEKVNKTQLMKELSDELAIQLEGTYEPEYSARLCMIGAEMLFKKLRLPHVIKAVCDCEGMPSYIEIEDNECVGCGKPIK